MLETLNITSILGIPLWILLIVMIWSLIWKGCALWKAARKNSKIWFVVLLVVNTLGILEILYIFWLNKCCTKQNSKPKSRKRR